MGLISISDLEVLYGSDFSEEEEVQVQGFIDLISHFVESETGQSFTTKSNQVIVTRADGKGIIEIPNLQSISNVEILDYWTGAYGGLALGLLGYGFDGVDRVMGLLPYRTYRITCTYGHTSVPDDIKDVVKLLVLAGSGLDSAAVNGLVLKRVGDIEEAYGVTKDEMGGYVVTLSSLMSRVLARYNTDDTNIRL